MSHRPTDRSLREGVNRRDVLLNGSSALAAACIASMAPVSITSAIAQLPSRRPHIIYIVADDLGWKDVGFHGSDIKTPNIDRLAQNGARLEQFYVQPMCTPTRAALMTGRYPCRYGLQTLVIPTPSKYGLPTDELAAAAGTQGRRLPDCHGRQVAPGARRSQVLASPARIRLPLRINGGRGRLLHAFIGKSCATGIVTTDP